MIILAFGVSWVVNLFSRNEIFGAVIGGSALIASDLGYRVKYGGDNLFISLISPTHGGQLFFFPIWILGIFATISFLVTLLPSSKK